MELQPQQEPPGRRDNRISPSRPSSSSVLKSPGCVSSLPRQEDVILSFQAAPRVCVNVLFSPAAIGWMGYLLELEGKWCNYDLDFSATFVHLRAFWCFFSPYFYAQMLFGPEANVMFEGLVSLRLNGASDASCAVQQSEIVLLIL